MSTSYVGLSAIAGSGVGAITVAWPAGHQANDIGVLIVQHANQAPSTPAGWTLIADVGTGSPGAAGATGLSAFWKRASSAAEADVSVADGGDHQRGRILAFRGCETSGSPIDTSAFATVLTAATAISCPAVTTSVADCMVLALAANGTDSSSNQTTSGSWANANLTSPTYVLFGNTTAGVGGGAYGLVGNKATAGSTGATTSTFATATAQALLTIALKPPAGAPPAPTVTNGGIYVATGEKATAGATGTTSATMDTAGIQARLTFALKPPAAPPANLPPVVAQIPSIGGIVNGLVIFPITYLDPEGDTVTFSLVDGTTAVPTGAEVLQDESSADYHFEWTPTADQAGEWSFYLRATDGTNTVDTLVSIIVQTLPDDTMLALAKALANRTNTDLESARALAELLDDTQQINANVITEVRRMIADLEESQAYVQSVVDSLNEETDPT